VGLFGMREWAWKTTIFLSVAPSHDLWIASPLQPEAIFRPDAGIKYAILTVGDFGIVVVYMHVRDSYPSERMGGFSFFTRESVVPISIDRPIVFAW